MRPLPLNSPDRASGALHGRFLPDLPRALAARGPFRARDISALQSRPSLVSRLTFPAHRQIARPRLRLANSSMRHVGE